MELNYSEIDTGNVMVNENFYQVALDAMEEGIIIVDRDDIIQYLNVAACALLGYSKEEIINQPLDPYYFSAPDTSVEALIHYSGRNINSSNEKPYPFKIVTVKDGRIIQIEEEIIILFNSENEHTGRMIKFKNMDVVREEEIKSFSEKEYYLKVIEDLPYLICRANKDGQFNYFNRQWLDFTGRSINREIYRGWLEKIHPADAPMFEGILEAALAEQESARMELRLLNHDGEYRWLLCMLNPIYDIDENFAGLLCLCIDITESKMLENELVHAKEVSETANKVKNTFLANMSHEIRTPLNSIMGLTEVLAETKLDDEQGDMLKIIKQSSYTLLALLNNLIESSRIDDSKNVLNENNFSIPDLIETVCGLFRFQAEKNSIDFSYDIQQDIPEMLFGDNNKLKFILINLVMNALKFTREGFVRLQVLREDADAEDSAEKKIINLHFKISDSGIGIDDTQKDMVFESFTQVDDSNTRRYAGAGLGLSIVKKLTDVMMGRVWLESKLGQGSCFHVILRFRIALSGK